MKKLNQTKPIIYFKANRKLDIFLARPGNIFQPLQNPPTIQEEPIIRTQAAISPEHVLRTESDVSFEPGFIFEYNLPHSFQQNLPEDLSEASNTSPVALQIDFFKNNLICLIYMNFNMFFKSKPKNLFIIKSMEESYS